MHSSMRRILLIACATALAVAFTVSLQRPTRAAEGIPSPPAVPFKVQVPEGSKLFFMGHAVGTQNYVCRPSGDGVKFTLFTPQATLFSDGKREQVTTHFFSPNPEQDNAIRATWQHSRDTSTVWAEVQDDHMSSDSAFVKPGAVAWLMLTVVGHQDGPTGGDLLSGTKFIQRLNTVGGLAPSTGCSSPADIGKSAFVPYKADYFFYK